MAHVHVGEAVNVGVYAHVAVLPDMVPYVVAVVDSVDTVPSELDRKYTALTDICTHRSVELAVADLDLEMNTFSTYFFASNTPPAAQAVLSNVVTRWHGRRRT